MLAIPKFPRLRENAARQGFLSDKHYDNLARECAAEGVWLRAMFATLPGQVTLIYRASSPDDVVFGPELDAIARDRGGTVHYLIGSRAQLGGDPLSAERLLSLVPGLRRYDVYVCGPAGMQDSALAALTAAGVPRSRIHHESFEF